VFAFLQDGVRSETAAKAAEDRMVQRLVSGA
jgi:hypothetical protein